MRYDVELTRAASSCLRRLDKLTRNRIGRRLDELCDDPRSHSKSLTAVGGTQSSRVGDYRILFEIHEGRLVVLVLAIPGRS